MKRLDLVYEFPDELVAIKPSPKSRVMWVKGEACEEISIEALLNRIEPGDVLVINQSKVIPRRVFCNLPGGKELEVLFLSEQSEGVWKVLLPASRMKKDGKFLLPGNIEGQLLERGRPQIVQVSQPLSIEWFEKFGEPPLPPYIQKARGERHSNDDDRKWYQTAWAKNYGSSAAPTASLHFTLKDLEKLSQKGVRVLPLTLHVGLGTFLPVEADDLSDHPMHSEFVEIPVSTWEQIVKAKEDGRRIWALGTTVARSLESQALQKFPKNGQSYVGATDLLIQEGFQFKVVDILMTNFHQPESTLLALVAGFAGLGNLKRCYGWAIEKKFRLFSYGDLSVWVKRE